MDTPIFNTNHIPLPNNIKMYWFMHNAPVNGALCINQYTGLIQVYLKIDFYTSSK